MLHSIGKIKVLHLLTVPEHLRERKSVNNIISLCAKHNFDYYQSINEPYEDHPPKNNVLFGNSHWVLGKNKNKGEWGLTSGHYGCFIAHRNAIINFSNQNIYRWMLIVECDCKVLCDSMADKIKQSIMFMVKTNYKIFTFGRCEAPVVVCKDICESTEIYGTQMYLLDNAKSNFYKYIFEKYGWHTIDLWYNEVFKIEKEKFLCRENIFTSQYHKEGSLIDRWI